VYTGNQEDRQIIRSHEFYYADGSSCELKFNVLLTSFEILMKDLNKLARETWQYIIVDEAHRLFDVISCLIL
jgi:SNF2 family DNA or RNA helicase